MEQPVVHTADLIERHAFAVPAPIRPDEALWDGQWYARARQDAWAELTLRAEEWAEANDLAVEIEPFEKLAADGSPRTWGVKFTVVVGRGMGDSELAWTWSRRWEGWLSVFKNLAQPRLTVIPGGKVLPLTRKKAQ